MPESKKEKVKIEHKDSEARGLYRSESNKVLAGVAGGLGEYFNIDSNIIRIAFILLAIFGGSGLIIYIVLWLIILQNQTAPKTRRRRSALIWRI